MSDPEYAYFEDVNWGVMRLWAGRKGADVLDVGCGFATTSAEIEKLGNRVTGIELNGDAAVKASSRLTAVVQSDLGDLGGVAARLGSAMFDVVMFADVLEHLPDPLPVLRDYLRFLRPGGSVIVSLPNVALWSVRLMLLAGRFDYADSGVLDRTHLRFFTRTTAKALVADAGLRVVRTTLTPGIVRPFVPLVKSLSARRSEGQHDPAALMQSPAYRAYLKLVYPIEHVLSRLAPGLLAFQTVVEAVRR